MLIEDATFCELLRRIVARFTADRVLQDDLMQECLIRIWRLEREEPGRTRSWYLQNCRFHVQHWLASGRSVDSLKRTNGDNRVTIDVVSDDTPVDGYHTNGDFFEGISANDLVSTLSGFLKPHESALLKGLADGLVLQDVALKLKLSYPTALKYRRKIAALTIKLGIPPPLPYKRQHTRPGRQPLHVSPDRSLPGGESPSRSEARVRPPAPRAPPASPRRATPIAAGGPRAHPGPAPTRTRASGRAVPRWLFARLPAAEAWETLPDLSRPLRL